MPVSNQKEFTASLDRRTYTGLRDYVIILLMLDTGVRTKELLSLRNTDYFRNGKYLCIEKNIAKTRKKRIAYLSSSTANVYDIFEAGIEKGRHLIAINQEMMVKEGLITAEESKAAMDRMAFTMDKKCFRDCCLVVESTVERMDIKQNFFAEVSEIAPKEALLATNTSGLHITEIAKACKYPERFMGQHWLNPPRLLPLCEIIAGEETSQENLQKMRELVVGLPGNGTIPAVESQRILLAKHAGMKILDLVREDVRPRDIVTEKSIKKRPGGYGPGLHLCPGDGRSVLRRQPRRVHRPRVPGGGGPRPSGRGGLFYLRMGFCQSNCQWAGSGSASLYEG